THISAFDLTQFIACVCVTPLPLPLMTYVRKMAARRGKRAADRSTENSAKRAKINRKKTSQTQKNTKRVTFTAENEEKNQKSQTDQDQTNIISVPPPVSMGKWTNKERVLVFSSRGINFRTRHLMQDLKTMMPHSKADTKMDRKDKLFVVNEVCEIKNCNKCIFFEAKKKQDLYMWISNVPHGPSAKFLVQNVHTLAELKMTGNCLKGSRPLLSFDPKFDQEPHYALLKELFTQIFSTPQYHPRSQPFVDHVLTFTIADNRIWFRNYQIIEEDASLVEIGPRFVLNLIKIFQGSFGGPTLYENPHFQSPNMHRRMIRLAMAAKQKERQMVKEIKNEKRKEGQEVMSQDVTDDVFVTPAEQKPVQIELDAPKSQINKKKLKLTELKKKKLMKRKGL
ncbi:ribosome biogenesis protein BRX1 homolog, partial [Myxocyprinus asiaticus]|uniref:ribosome biogenesis protein BRX1 homolog n=1 Tax=Myxocyprinus asiaticus TaxID=70543 RepID=UPI002221D5D3